VRALALLVVAALPAAADVELGGRPSLRLGAGYDDNLFLDAQPSGPNPAQIRSDAIFDVQPSLLGWLETRRHTLSLSADYLDRLTTSSGDLRDANIGLGWISPRWRRISFSLGGRYEHWTTKLYPEDTFDLGGAEAGLRLWLHERVGLDAQYRFAARAYSDPLRLGQLDDDHRVRGALWVRPSRWLHVEAGYTYTHIHSTNDSASLDRHRVELSVAATPLPWLLLSAAYAIAPQHLPGWLHEPVGMSGMYINRTRDDLVQWLDVSVTTRPVKWLELYARYQLVSSSSTDPSGEYRRNQVIAGAVVRWDFVHLVRPLVPRVRGSVVTFRHRGPPGR